MKHETSPDYEQISMKVLEHSIAKKMIIENHYSGRIPPSQLSLGFYVKNKLNCVIMFGPSATPKMAASLPSSNYWELSRLFSFDWGGKNIESFCIARALKYVEKNCKKDVVVSFADPSQNHVGYIYQATNWLYCGMTDQTGGYTYFFDEKWQHPRSTVAKYGTRKHSEILKIAPGVEFKRIDRKHRYIYLLGSKKKRKALLKALKYPILPYPKLNSDGRSIKSDTCCLPAARGRCDPGSPLSKIEIEKIAKIVSGNLSFVTALQAVLPEGETVPTKAAKRPGKKMSALLGQTGIGPALAKTDEGCLMLLAHSKDEVRELMLARKAVKSWPLHLKRVESMKALATACDGRMPVPLNYYGAHTGRWSGGGGINLLNLGGAGRAGHGTNPLITKMRQMLRVNDSKLLIADAAQIEVRVLAWLAGQQDMLTAFREDRSIYSDFGTKLFVARVRKPRKSDPPPIYDLLSVRYGFSKDTILGSGFGMGPNKFYNNCLQNPGLRPMFDSGQYDRKFVEKLIYGYRNTYFKIPKFWKMVEKCFRLVTKYPHEVMRYAPEGSTVGPGDLLTFWNNGGTVNVQLPSGRVLYYPHAAIKKKVNKHDYDNQLKYHHGLLWGGSLTENIVQAVARDLLVYWILKAEEFGLPVVLHVYDEILAVSSTIYAEDNLKTLMNIMSNGPEWSAGLPLTAEGEISETYKK